MVPNHSGSPIQTPFQVGTLVSDLRHQVDVYTDLSIGPWAESGWTTQGRYYDARARRMVQPRVRMALGRLTADTCLEFIEVDPASEVPWAWDNTLIGTPAHLGYWTHDVGAQGRRLTDMGARLVTARASVAAGSQDRVAEALAAGEWPSGLAMAYLQLGDGLLVELVATDLWPVPLRERFGADAIKVVPAPPS